MVNSDHTLLSIRLYKKNLIDKTNHKPTWQKGTTKVVNVKNTTNEQWNEYVQKVDKKIHKLEVNKHIKNMLNKLTRNKSTAIEKERETEEEADKDNLDKIWEEFRKILITSIYASLKIKKVKGTRQDSTEKERKHPPEFKKYQRTIKMVKTLNKTMRSQKKEDLENLNIQIEKFNKKNAPM